MENVLLKIGRLIFRCIKHGLDLRKLIVDPRSTVMLGVLLVDVFLAGRQYLAQLESMLFFHL